MTALFRSSTCVASVCLGLLFFLWRAFSHVLWGLEEDLLCCECLHHMGSHVGLCFYPPFFLVPSYLWFRSCGLKEHV